jgi:CheY-like chemotaxis protein
VSPWEFHFSVRDTGIGIPEDRIGRLFKSFSQVDSSIARQFGGTGLGLAISKGLVELMGGRIWVDSQVGQGSVFHFKLPLQAVPGPSQSTAFRPRVAGKRVLIVDDNPTHRRILVGLAQRWAMIPCAVEGATQALDLASKGDRFDFAIIDAQLPGMNGGQLADELRRLPHTQALPVLLMTPIGARTELPPSARSAFTACLTKPLKPAQLQAALLQLVSGTKPAAGKPATVQTREPLLASRYPLRVLVTDDNVINQKVASRLLQQMGYKADVASTGLEAIQALEREPYDMILMDVQMPELDGLDATRRIRQHQQKPAPHPHFRRSITIIAMTANAMHGDREKCLAAGMDDYLPKPIRPEMLHSMIERFGGGLDKSAGSPSVPEANLATALPPACRSTVAPPASDAGPEAPVDLERLTEFAGGSPEAFRELVDIFVKQTTEQIGQMEVALQTGAADRLARVAHSCAGASSTAGMLAVVPALRRLEALGKVGDLATAPPQLTTVRQEFDRIKRFLEKQPNPVNQSTQDRL